MKKDITAFLLLLALLFTKCENTAPDTNKFTLREQSKLETINALDLYNAYEGNAVNADDKFYRKYIIVSGAILQIDKDEENVFVSLDCGGVNEKIKCFMTNGSEVSKLKPNNIVSIKGVCLGKRHFIGNILTDENYPTLIWCILK